MVSSNDVAYQRVISFAHLFVDDGMSIQEIVDCMNDDSITFWTVYQDLTLELSKIDIELYEKVSDIMNSNRLNNMKRGK